MSALSPATPVRRATQHPSRRPGFEAAFTLVEIVVAIAILATALVAVFAISGAAIDSTRETGEAFLAAQIAANALEEIRAGAVISNSFSARFFDDQAIPLPDSESANALFRLHIEVSESPSRPGQKTLEAHVTYPWLGAERDAQTTGRFTTLVFAPEPVSTP